MRESNCALRGGAREWLTATLLLLAGCEATAIGGEAPTQSESEIAAQTVVRSGQRPALKSLFGRLGTTAKLSGTLCSGDAELSGDSGLGAVSVSGVLDTSAPDAPRRGTCTVEFDVTIPAGYQVGSPAVCANFLHAPGTPSGLANIAMKAQYQGASAVGSVTKTLGDTNGSERGICASFPEVATSCSDVARTVKFALSVDMATGADSFLQLGAIETDLSYGEGTTFRSCSSRFPLPAPSASGEPCGGPNRHGCSSGLACRTDHLTYTSLAGRCVRPAEANQPRKNGEVCGAGLPPACAPELLCVPSGYERNGQSVGNCTSKISNQGDPCGGTTGRTCREDLYCSELGRCEDLKDQTTTRREGDPCDGVNWCQLGLTCDADTGICRKSRGTWGEGCRRPFGDLETIACAEGFTCTGNNICRTVDGLPGASCVLNNECRSDDCDTTARRCR